MARQPEARPTGDVSTLSIHFAVAVDAHSLRPLCKIALLGSLKQSPGSTSVSGDTGPSLVRLPAARASR
jgi:hypothetical protein